MLGAIAGDVIGSVYEGLQVFDPATGLPRPGLDAFQPLFHRRARFTDDTVMTIAVAEHLLGGGDLVNIFKEYGRAYPRAGYGGTFKKWVASDDRDPYNSWGNGSAMRVSPVAHAFDTMDDVVAAAQRSAAVTHNHPEGVRGACATAAAVFLARNGASKAEIRANAEGRWGYDLSRTLDQIRPTLGFDVSCQGTVPPALRAFLEADDFERTVRLAVSLGGDADTLACIAGSVAGAFYGVPGPIRAETLGRLDGRLRGVLDAFERRFPAGPGG